MIKAIIFDCFGILFADRRKDAIERLQPSPKQQEAIDEIVAQKDNGQLLNEAAPRLIADALGITEHEWLAELGSVDYEPVPDVLGLIGELKENYRIGLMTNIGIGRINDYLSDELRDQFDVIFASGDRGVAKPSREAYQQIIDEFGISADEALMVDDSAGFLSQAEEMGMRVILFESIDQLRKDLTKKLS